MESSDNKSFVGNISLFKKQRFLLNLSEDNFRDQVVRPLFLRIGFTDGRDMCGPSEAGKDAVFFRNDPFGNPEAYVIQTKKGSLNESREKKKNVVEAITQMRTAMETSILMVHPKAKVKPVKVYLIASGKINDASKNHVIDNLKDSRIAFMDADDIVPLIDQHCPEVWMSLEADLFPYFKALVADVDSGASTFAVNDGLTGDAVFSAACDSEFVALKAFHLKTKTIRKPKFIRSKGKNVRVNDEEIETPDFEELPLVSLPSRSERSIILLGEAGAGKSTALRRIAYTLAKKGLELTEKYKVPVVLRARDVAKRSSSLLEMASDETKRLANSKNCGFSGGDLTKGNVLLLLDALDEATADADKKNVIRLMFEFQTAYPKCQIILSSRDYGFVQSLEGLERFAQFRILPIDFKQAEQILQRVSKKSSLPADTAKELLRRLQQVHGMDLNPLLVTVFAATSDYARKDVPANITELFKKYTEQMLGRWDHQKGLAQQYHAPLKDFVVRQIAFEMHRRKVTSIDVGEFQSAIEGELSKRGHSANAHDLIDEIVNRSGLFRTTGNSVEFRHHLLQEFFAGRGIPTDELIETILDDEWWQRPIVFYFGEHPENASVLKRLSSTLANRPSHKVFPSSIALGLALQAAYLVEIPDKLSTLVEVIRGLAASHSDFGQDFPEHKKFPLSTFLTYSLCGRDAVASDLLNEHFDQIGDMLKTDSLFQKNDEEVRRFWMLMGLVESGHLEKAEGLVKDFHPTDNRFEFAIFLGCALMLHTRVMHESKAKCAARLSQALLDRTPALRQQMMDEFRTLLVEIRKGKLTPIDLDGSEASEPKQLPALKKTSACE